MIEREFDQAGNRILFRVTGEVEPGSFFAAINQSIAHPEFVPGMNSLWDLSAADLDGITRADVEHASSEKRKNAAERGNARVAILVSDDLGNGLSRMFAAMSSLAHIDYQVFASMDAANDWLGNEPAGIDG